MLFFHILNYLLNFFLLLVSNQKSVKFTTSKNNIEIIFTKNEKKKLEKHNQELCNTEDYIFFNFNNQLISTKIEKKNHKNSELKICLQNGRIAQKQKHYQFFTLLVHS